MRMLTLGLVLLLPALAAGQDYVFGKQITPADLKKAQEQVTAGQAVLDLAKKGNTVQIQIGDYLTIAPPKDLPGPFLWVLGGAEDAIERVDIAAGERFSTYAKHYAEKAAAVHRFEPQPAPWTQVLGVHEGKVCVTIIANGAAGKSPVVIDKLTIVVGTPKPPPPPPDADVLLKAAAADISAGNGTADDLATYRAYLLNWVNALPATVQYATAKDFWTAFQAGRRAAVGDTLPTMRKAVGEVLNQQVPEKEGDAMDAARRTAITATLKTIASRLESK